MQAVSEWDSWGSTTQQNFRCWCHPASLNAEKLFSSPLKRLNACESRTCPEEEDGMGGGGRIFLVPGVQCSHFPSAGSSGP